MTNAQQKPKTRKQLIQEAIDSSLASQWEEVIAINDTLLERFPRDAEAFNRKGRAYMELRRPIEARESYQEALKADPANMIARRNLQRLEILYNREGGSPDDAAASDKEIPPAAMFIEEIGRTWADILAHPADKGTIAEVSPGDKLGLKVDGDRIKVVNGDVELGEIELTIGSRIKMLMDQGHVFEVYSLGMSMDNLRVIVREVSRPEENENVIAFPRQDFFSQDLLRQRQQLSQRDEGDFVFGEDDDEEEDEEVADDSGEDEDEESPDFAPGSSSSDDDDEEDMQ